MQTNQSTENLLAITCGDLKQRMGEGKRWILLDVREDFEREICVIPRGSFDEKHIPLGEIEKRAGELVGDTPVVVYCRSGRRSAVAANALRGLGCKDVRNLTGGIDAWAAEIDPSMPRY